MKTVYIYIYIYKNTKNGQNRGKPHDIQFLHIKQINGKSTEMSISQI